MAADVDNGNDEVQESAGPDEGRGAGVQPAQTEQQGDAASELQVKQVAPFPGLDIFAVQVSKLKEKGQNWLKLADGLLRYYTGGYGVPSLLPGYEGLEAESADASKTPEKRLQEFYRLSKAGHLADGGTHESFNAEMFLILNAVLALPFGSDEHRKFFDAGVREALRGAAAEGNPDRAAEVFAGGVISTSGEMTTKYGSADFRKVSDPSRSVVWHPELEGSTYISGGVSYTGAQIAELYNAKAGLSNAQYGRDIALFFTDDRGDVFVAAVHNERRMFMVEKVDKGKMGDVVKAMRRFVETGRQDLDLIAELKQEDRAFELVFSKDGSRNLGGDYLHFAERATTAGRIPSLQQEMAADYAGQMRERQEREKQAAQTGKAAERPSYISSAPPPQYEGGRPSQSISASEMLPDDIRKKLAEAAAPLRRGATILYPGDKRLELFQSVAGRKLQIGASLESSFRLKGVDTGRAGEGPHIVWYDLKENVVKVAAMPAELSGSGLRQAAGMATGESQQDYYQRLEREHPLLFEIARNYHGGPERLAGEPATLDHYWNFNVTMENRVIRPLSQVQQSGPLAEPRQNWLAGLFSKGAGEGSTPVEEKSFQAENRPVYVGSTVSGADQPENAGAGSGVFAGLRCEFDKIKSQILYGKTVECGKSAEFRLAGDELTGLRGPAFPDPNYGPTTSGPGMRRG